MTLDELDKKIINIKSKGLAKIVELQQIREVRSEYYKERISSVENILSARLFKNINYLATKFKSFPSNNNIQEFMGITLSPYFDVFIKNQGGILPFKDMVVISEYYGVPLNLLIFEDIEIYGEQIWKEYNTIFKQGKY
jgi:hypothetical protein